VKAKLRYLQTSPKKVKLVIDLVRGLPVTRAIEQLRFLRQGAARPVKKLIESAIGNAAHNLNLDPNILMIKTIKVDQGPTTRRWMPRAFGRAGQILKRTSHITVILEDDQNLAVTKKLPEIKSKKAVNDKEKTDDKKNIVPQDKHVAPDVLHTHKPEENITHTSGKKRSQNEEQNIDKHELADKKAKE